MRTRLPASIGSCVAHTQTDETTNRAVTKQWCFDILLKRERDRDRDRERDTDTERERKRERERERALLPNVRPKRRIQKQQGRQQC